MCTFVTRCLYYSNFIIPMWDIWTLRPPVQDLVVALSIFVHVVGDGAMVLCMALNQLKEGLFERFLMEARGQ